MACARIRPFCRQFPIVFIETPQALAISAMWWQFVRDDVLHIPFGKTENARRRIPLTQRATACFP